MGQVKFLKCRECGGEYPPTAIHVCPECFGPLDVTYDYATIKLDRETLQSRSKSLWRYWELLPVQDWSKVVDIGGGFTILQKSVRLGKILGLKNLYFKNDSVNPTFSFKDRPASVAVSKALEFGFKAVGCASTGNLAAAVAAHAARADLPCYVFIPSTVEPNKVIQAEAYGAKIVKVDGTYDNANRLATQAAEKNNWAFVNINIRPYYVEGSKTLAFEVVEQLDWEVPDHAIVPLGSGALINAIRKGFGELEKIGLTSNGNVKLTGVQAEGCAPIVHAFKSHSDRVVPVEHPKTVAESLAIGEPGDGEYAVRTIRQSGGFAESATDAEILEAIRLLAETEGIFTEPAGGVTVAALKKLVENGFISPDEKVVCYITGNGLKTVQTFTAYKRSTSEKLELKAAEVA